MHFSFTNDQSIGFFNLKQNILFQIVTKLSVAFLHEVFEEKKKITEKLY